LVEKHFIGQSFAGNFCPLWPFGQSRKIYSSIEVESAPYSEKERFLMKKCIFLIITASLVLSGTLTNAAIRLTSADKGAVKSRSPSSVKTSSMSAKDAAVRLSGVCTVKYIQHNIFTEATKSNTTIDLSCSQLGHPEDSLGSISIQFTGEERAIAMSLQLKQKIRVSYDLGGSDISIGGIDIVE
jgi:hypothetical protein